MQALLTRSGLIPTVLLLLILILSTTPSTSAYIHTSIARYITQRIQHWRVAPPPATADEGLPISSSTTSASSSNSATTATTTSSSISASSSVHSNSKSHSNWSSNWSSWSHRRITGRGASTNDFHDNVTYRVRSGEILYIPQAERYSTKDWWHNLKTLPTSYLLKRISSVILFNALWSVVTVIVHHFVKFQSPGSRAHALLGSALGLLLVFRTNTAYNRFWEGRIIWEKLLSGLRSTASMIVTYAPYIAEARTNKLLNLLCAFPVCLQEHIQGTRQPKQLSKFLDAEQLLRLDRVTNRPLFLMHCMNVEICSIALTDNQFTSRERQALLKNVESFGRSIGCCERIVQTPVPLSYARHTSRFLSIWSITLPYALVSEIGWGVIPFSIFVSWALFGIQEIGMLIEEPFRRSLQIEVFANTIRRDISDLVHIAAGDIINITTPALDYKVPFFQRKSVLSEILNYRNQTVPVL